VSPRGGTVIDSRRYSERTIETGMSVRLKTTKPQPTNTATGLSFSFFELINENPLLSQNREQPLAELEKIETKTFLNPTKNSPCRAVSKNKTIGLSPETPPQKTSVFAEHRTHSDFTPIEVKARIFFQENYFLHPS
jgi:hypothetical protein